MIIYATTHLEGRIRKALAISVRCHLCRTISEYMPMKCIPGEQSHEVQGFCPNCRQGGSMAVSHWTSLTTTISVGDFA